VRKIIKLTESDLVNIVKRVISETTKKTVITESINVGGAEISVVPINWKDPKVGKYSGQIKVVYAGKVRYYKLTVDTAFYDGAVLIQKLWTNSGGDGYTVKDSTGKTFNIKDEQMNSIVKKVKEDNQNFTVQSSLVDLTLNRTA
jgi:hypothetical protein